MRDFALVPVPGLGVGKAEQGPAPNLQRQCGMQQQSAQRAAFADRPKSVGARSPASQGQLAGVLDHDNVAAGNAGCRARHRLAKHLLWGHRSIVQKASKPHLLRPVTPEPADTTARLADKGCMKRSPPFSRRRSPNRPSPNSRIIDLPRESTIDPRNHPCQLPATEMCAFDSRKRGEVEIAALLCPERSADTCGPSQRFVVPLSSASRRWL